MKKYDLVPLVLLIYLGVMVWLGYPDYVAGATSPALYFGGTAFTLVVIILLRFNLKKREQYRQARKKDIEEASRRKAENTGNTNEAECEKADEHTN